MTDLECWCYGVGQADEGVCLLVRMGPYRVLLDCGLADVTQLSYLALDAVICTHAHGDHARGLEALRQHFPDVPIYASEVTTQLLRVPWAGFHPFHHSLSLPWRSPLEICPGLSVQIWPSGHLPGAACVLLSFAGDTRRQTIFYTGDCMLSQSRLVDGMPLDELNGLKPDVLIVDSSYGTGRYPRRKEQENQLADVILRAIAQRHSVILPTTQLGQGQELLMLLRNHHHFTGQDIDIWVSANVATGCDTYADLLPQLPSAVQNFAQYQSLFWDDRVRPRVHRLPLVADATEQSEMGAEWRDAIASSKPTILMTDPTIHLDQYCNTERAQWTVFLPQEPGQVDLFHALSAQIQASPSLQTKIQSGRVKLFPYSLGEHCDGPALMQLIHSIRPQHLIFVHGPDHFRSDLASQEELQVRYQLHLPTINSHIELPISDRFIQPAPPQLRYTGELTGLQTTVLLTLNSQIQADPRWRTLADTGVVEAQWQGDELVIRGISSQELALTGAREQPFMVECCDRCRHYRDRRCGNKESSLFGFRVAPEGCCPVFETR
ncbi:MAG: MBL fold metallo-hydrolase [Leptolyngbyaceae bacterium]|nr:MBL fold metallo-hydrolase [Leptolyngbyaceae bacterium]